MAKTKWRDCVVMIGTANPPTTAVTSKKDVDVDGEKQITDDTTTDDSVGPEHEVIYAGQIESVSFPVIKDRADASYLILETAANAGTKIYCAVRPEGTQSGVKKEQLFQCTVSLKGGGSSSGMSRQQVTLKVTNGNTFQTQP